MLDAATIAVIKKTAPILASRAEELTNLFYERLFTANPEVRPLFSTSHQRSGVQQRALAGAIVAYATHIDQLEALGPAVGLITHKHASLGIQPEHYPIVGKNLLAAIQDLLGDAATEEILSAWGKAYGVLAEMLIKQEAALYEEHDRSHGWRGFRRFRVAKRTIESDEIVSFYLEPVDGKALGKHRPGQYLTIRIPCPDGTTTMRNYSLSNPPGSPYYRISVKRERASRAGTPDGHVSGYLHEHARAGAELEIAPPCGEFVFDPSSGETRPLVLISGGIGVTPLLSMAHAAVDEKVDRDIWFIHAARNARVHAFAAEVRRLAERHPRFHIHICYDEVETDGLTTRPEARCDTHGRIDLLLLQRLLPGPDADFYFCGPKPFMEVIAGALRAWNVPEAQIRYEFFGPSETLNPAPATA